MLSITWAVKDSKGWRKISRCKKSHRTQGRPKGRTTSFTSDTWRGPHTGLVRLSRVLEGPGSSKKDYRPHPVPSYGPGSISLWVCHPSLPLLQWSVSLLVSGRKGGKGKGWTGTLIVLNVEAYTRNWGTPQERKNHNL